MQPKLADVVKIPNGGVLPQDASKNRDPVEFTCRSHKDDTNMPPAVIRSGRRCSDAGSMDAKISNRREVASISADLKLEKGCAKKSLPALDGGWGWMCVVGCGLMHFLQGGNGRSFGVVYVKMLDKFDCSAAMGSTIGGLFSAFRMGCGRYSGCI